MITVESEWIEDFLATIECNFVLKKIVTKKPQWKCKAYWKMNLNHDSRTFV